MKLTPVANRESVKQVTTNETAKRAAAVNAFNNASQATQAAPVDAPPPIPVNPNAINPEDISAVKTQTAEPPQQQEKVDTKTEVVADTTPPPTETRQEPQREDTSSQFQLLARKERQLRAKAQQQEQALKAEREKFLNDKAQLEARIKELETNSIPRNKLKDETWATLEEEGITYDSLTQDAINAQQRNPRYDAYINKLEAKIKTLEERTQKAEQQQQEAADSQYKAALNQIRTDVNDLVKADPSFELIRTTKSQKDVVDLIEQTWKKDGVILSVEKASQEVEDYLAEEATKLANTNKIKSRLSQAPATSTRIEKQTPTNNQQTQTMKTLTNAASSTRTLSARERAIMAFRGELKG